MSPKKSLPEYWHEVFVSRGFQQNLKLNEGSLKMVLYYNGDLQISFSKDDLEHGISPYFYFWFQNSLEVVITIKDIRVSGSFASPSPRLFGTEREITMKPTQSITKAEFLFVLDHITEPEKVPLLLGIGWIAPIVSILFKEEQV